MTDDELDARLTAAGDRWRTANTATAHVDLGLNALDVVDISPAATARQRRTRWVAALVVAAVVAIVAIALALVPDRSNHDVATPPAGSLVNTHWALSAYAVSGRATGTDLAPRLSFTKGHVAGGDGCNSLSGDISINDTTIAFGRLSTTLLACDASASRVASAVGAVLTGTVRWQVRGDVLTIGGSPGTYLLYVRLDPVPSVSPAMLDGTWIGESDLLGAERTFTSTYRLSFGATIARVDTAQCQGAVRDVTIGHGSIIFDTRVVNHGVLCRTDQTTDEATRQADELLVGAALWSVHGGVLDITRPGIGFIRLHRPATPSAAGLAGTWQLDKATKLDGSTSKTLSTSKLHLVVDGSLRFTLSVCDTLTGRFVVVQNELTVADRQRQIQRCVFDPNGTDNNWVAELLQGNLTAEITAGQLTITKPQVGTLTFRQMASANSPVGTWDPVTLNGAPIHLAGPVVLQADGYTVRYFCRIETGTLAHSGQQLTFTDGGNAQTVPCASGASAADQRERAILSGTVTWTLAGNRLTLTKAGVGTLTLTFH